MAAFESSLAIISTPDFEELYPTATATELEENWRAHCGDPADCYVQTHLALGVLREPKTPPRIYVSVDLCEVVRQTHLAIRGMEELPGTNTHREPYGYEMTTVKTWRDVRDIARVLINSDLVPPDPEAPGIAAFLRNWRRQGAYIFANTATSEGCELGTVRFLGEYLPHAFDGIVFARNHDASGQIKKGTVAREVVDTLGASKPAFIAHIDDSARHLATFRPSFGSRPNTNIDTFQVQYDNVANDPDSPGSLSRLQTFVMADIRVREALTRLSLRGSEPSVLS